MPARAPAGQAFAVQEALRQPVRTMPRLRKELEGPPPERPRPWQARPPPERPRLWQARPLPEAQWQAVSWRQGPRRAG